MQIKEMLREIQQSFYLLNEAMDEDYKKLDERITKLETHLLTSNKPIEPNTKTILK